MQLRSGNIIKMKPINSNDENISITTKSAKKRGKVVENIIAKHSMILRSNKQEEVAHPPSSLTNLQIPTKSQAFTHWLICRLDGLAAEFHKYDMLSYNQLVLERTRLVVEMVAIISEHIDYIVTIRELDTFTRTLYSKLCDFKTEITELLNGNIIIDEDFSYQERVFLGNARVDIVKLITTMGYKLHSQ